MTTTTNVSQVKLNVMTQSQYNLATKSANELYMVTDAQINYNDLANKPNLATVATTGSYNDLSNKPTIPAAQVNSDWNANSGVAEILNKPSLATVATSGAYSDLSGTPTIPTQASDIGAQPTLVSGTNIKTINSTSLLGSGDISIPSLPSMSGNSGKYLTNDGSAASWAALKGIGDIQNTDSSKVGYVYRVEVLNTAVYSPNISNSKWLVLTSYGFASNTAVVYSYGTHIVKFPGEIVSGNTLIQNAGGATLYSVAALLRIQ